MLVGALGPDRNSVLRHSLGGRPIMAYAKRRPQIVDHAVIVDIGPEMDRAGGRKVRQSTKSQVAVLDVFADERGRWRSSRDRGPAGPRSSCGSPSSKA